VRLRRPTQRPRVGAVVGPWWGPRSWTRNPGPALRDALDVADGSAVGVALSVLMTEGFAVGSGVGMGDSSAGARSSTLGFQNVAGAADSVFGG
jgi:hypothetical protein